VLQVLGEVDGCHATLAELAVDAVAVRERGDQAGEVGAHALTMAHGELRREEAARLAMFGLAR
jgi:hypothetical protein